jgi:hypothetical protein
VLENGGYLLGIFCCWDFGREFGFLFELEKVNVGYE